MLFSLSDAAWRAVLLLLLGIAPYAAPPEAIGATTTLVACVRLSIFLAIASGATLALRRTGRRFPGFAIVMAATLLSLPILAAVFSAERGPLARAAWIASPLVWATIAAAVSGPLGSHLGSKVRARALGAGALVLGAASLLGTALKMGSRDILWRRALAMNPGDENAATAVAASDRSIDRRAAYEVLATCLRASPASCKCAEGAAAEAIDLERYSDARRALDATVTCTPTPRRMALTAEALVGVGSIEEGVREADLAIAHDPLDPHAVYARGWGSFRLGQVSEARTYAERAVALGRGVPARLLLGLVFMQAGELDRAATEFRAVLAVESTSAQATYDLALVAHRRDQYRDAREGYLRTLELDPTFADARYNLAILTQSRGALLEATHHVDVFAASFPNDPRITTLRRLLSEPAPRHALTMGP